MKKLLRLFWPLIAGKTKAAPAVVVAPNPPEFCETLTGATPGVRASSWVKFLPFNGRSVTCCRVTAAPSSAVELWTSAPTASTWTSWLISPIWRLKSRVAVWFTTKVKGWSLWVRKPGMLASSV